MNNIIPDKVSIVFEEFLDQMTYTSSIEAMRRTSIRCNDDHPSFMKCYRQVVFRALLGRVFLGTDKPSTPGSISA